MEFMTNEEIVRSYMQATNKVSQVIILSELNDTDAGTIIEILKASGVVNPNDMKKRICCRCGREYLAPHRKGIPTCADCKEVNSKIASLEQSIKRNNIKIAAHNRNIGRLVVSNNKMRMKIDELLKDKEVQE